MLPNARFALLVVLSTALASGQEISGEKVETARIAHGDLSVLIRDNSQSPKILSGLQSLFNLKDAREFDAFDPDAGGASAGLNFEHIISGHSNAENRFSPRRGRYSLYRLPDGKSAVLVRNAEDSPWKVFSTLKYTVNKPHYVDVDFRCKPQDPRLFGKRQYAVFFFADYMNDVAQIPIHFLGVDHSGGKEQWISAEAPRTHPDWDGGGTYRSVRAKDLQYDKDHNFKLNLWSYDYPRFTKPFYYGKTARNMVFIIMFNKMYTERDEIRFSIFKFKALRKVDPKPRPAWDFQYVIHNVEDGGEYGFQARVVWKKFVSADDCLAEYKKWASGLKR